MGAEPALPERAAPLGDASRDFLEDMPSLDPWWHDDLKSNLDLDTLVCAFKLHQVLIE